MIGADLRALLSAPRDPIPAVHPSWLPVIQTHDDPRIAVWLARSACADLPPVPAAPDPLPMLIATGRDMLAFATGLRDGLLASARTEHLTDRRAAIARCAGVQLDELGLIRVGARCLVLTRLQQQQLVLRLPKPIGLVVDAEFQARR